MPDRRSSAGQRAASVPASAAFYDAVLAPLGASRMMQFGDIIFTVDQIDVQPLDR